VGAQCRVSADEQKDRTRQLVRPLELHRVAGIDFHELIAGHMQERVDIHPHLLIIDNAVARGGQREEGQPDAENRLP
jgi:hypothetical protein